MRTSLALLAFAATAFAAPQAVTEAIAPKGKAPEGCKASYDGKFEVSIFRLGSSGKEKRDLHPRRECNGEGVLVMTLEDGVLKDGRDRTGYISSSFQFQFDGPPQSGALFTSGFSACSNQSLAIGSSAVFYQCQSGDFFNLYDRHWAEQCEPIEIVMMPCGGKSETKDKPKRKVVGSSVVATHVVTVVSDGRQFLQTTAVAVPMCQIGDGQVQVRTTLCDNMEIPIITAPPISQSSDGRIQVPTTIPTAVPAPAPPIPASEKVVPPPPQTPVAQPSETPAPAPAPAATPAEVETEIVVEPSETAAPEASETEELTVIKFDTSLPTETQEEIVPANTQPAPSTIPEVNSAPSAGKLNVIPASVGLFIGALGFVLFL